MVNQMVNDGRLIVNDVGKNLPRIGDGTMSFLPLLSVMDIKVIMSALGKPTCSMTVKIYEVINVVLAIWW